MTITINERDFIEMESYLFSITFPKKTDITMNVYKNDSESVEVYKYTTVNVDGQWLVATE